MPERPDTLEQPLGVALDVVLNVAEYDLLRLVQMVLRDNPTNVSRDAANRRTPSGTQGQSHASEYDARQLREESNWTFQPENHEQLHTLNTDRSGKW
jgi:hypothetical protein